MTLPRDRCVLVNSLSKTYAMTGWRVGYCLGPRELIQRMFLVLQQSSRGPALFVQDAAVAALCDPQDCVAEMREEIRPPSAARLGRAGKYPRRSGTAPGGRFLRNVGHQRLGPSF